MQYDTKSQLVIEKWEGASGYTTSLPTVDHSGKRVCRKWGGVGGQVISRACQL